MPLEAIAAVDGPIEARFEGDTSFLAALRAGRVEHFARTAAAAAASPSATPAASESSSSASASSSERIIRYTANIATICSYLTLSYNPSSCYPYASSASTTTSASPVCAYYTLPIGAYYPFHCQYTSYD